jgi:hypothetical protein
MEALLLLLGSLGLIALLDVGALVLGVDSRDGIGDDHRRASHEVA